MRRRLSCGETLPGGCLTCRRGSRRSAPSIAQRSSSDRRVADVRLSIAIQTHPDRDHLACALLEQIGEGELACDPEPDGRPNPWRTYRHALEATPADATHAAIVQDDV